MYLYLSIVQTAYATGFYLLNNFLLSFFFFLKPQTNGTITLVCVSISFVADRGSVPTALTGD